MFDFLSKLTCILIKLTMMMLIIIIIAVEMDQHKWVIKQTNE